MNMKSQHVTNLIRKTLLFVVGALLVFDIKFIKANDETLLNNITCITHDAKFICDCKNVDQRLRLPRLVGSVYEIEIKNCKSLTIQSNILDETQSLRKVTVSNIENLKLHKNAFAFPNSVSNMPLIVNFIEVNFEMIDSHAINGYIEEIAFKGGRMENIQPFSFNTLRESANLFKMDKVNVKNIRPQALKKFPVDQMEITNCLFENVPSKVFYEVQVPQKLFIHNNSFGNIHAHAFTFKDVGKISITNNKFLSVDSEWIEAAVREDVGISDNNFGFVTSISFKGITIQPNYLVNERLELRFINNTIRYQNEPTPLEFNDNFSLNIQHLYCDNFYDCQDLDTTQKPPKPKKNFFTTNINAIYFFHNSTSNSRSYMIPNYLVLNDIIERDCSKKSNVLLYAGLGILGLVIIISIIAIVVCLMLKRKRRRKLDIILPDPRTYKETQIVYQIENAGLLKTDF